MSISNYTALSRLRLNVAMKGTDLEATVIQTRRRIKGRVVSLVNCVSGEETRSQSSSTAFCQRLFVLCDLSYSLFRWRQAAVGVS